MKTKEQVETIIVELKKRISTIDQRISELTVWIDAGIKTKNESFVASIFSEKQDQNEKKRIAESQIKILEYVLN